MDQNKVEEVAKEIVTRMFDYLPSYAFPDEDEEYDKFELQMVQLVIDILKDE